MLRFIHCADLHLDRSFEGLYLMNESVDELLEINEKVLESIVSVAIKEAVDFVLLVGDTFHQNRPSLKTQHQFFTQMSRLEVADIPVYLSFGNHDYYEEARYWFDFPKNVHLFTEETVQTITGETKQGVSYCISGFSYQKPWLDESKVAQFPRRQGTYHIGMYHGDQQGEHYAPFVVQEMKQKGYDYWALGHIHVATTLSTQPPIIYPGTPQGHTQKEKETPGILLVTLTQGQATWEAIPVHQLSWQEITLSLAGVSNQRMALEEIQRLFTVSKKALIRLVLSETADLPKNWLNAKEKKELIAYLNHELQLHGFAQRIYQMEEIQVVFEQQVQLNASPALKLALFQQYQDADVFREVMAELLQHPIASKVMKMEAFQQGVFEGASKEIEQEYVWKGSDNETDSSRD
ncbi:MAG TPA: DNA repair exonuclease [Enterococcus aquimarinus]|nr:DNA repair exonuclease [Enterococcus aquimarinus]